MIYQLKGSLIRKKGQECNYIEVNELFNNPNLLVAREQAFSKYASYIEVFLDSIGKRYVSEKQSNADLQDFVNSYKRTYLNTPNGIITEIDTDADKGLFLYLIENENDFDLTLEGVKVYRKKHLIKAFHNNYINLEPYILDGLKHEQNFLKI